VREHKRGRTRVIVLDKEDMADSVLVHANIEHIIVEEGARFIAIDLAAVKEMQSLQLGCLVGLHLLAYENATILTFENVSERLRMLFGLLGIETLLEYHGVPDAQKD